MKALPSIAFSEFKGSAGSVTARVSKGRQIISAKSLHSRITTVAQAVRRCSFAAISRKYRSLSESQMAGWTALAKRLKGASVFGQSAELTPHNAFVRLNSNRKIAGMPLLLEAPAYIPDIPSVVFEDIWITLYGIGEAVFKYGNGIQDVSFAESRYLFRMGAYSDH